MSLQAAALDLLARAWRQLTPPPISPLFQPAGALAGFNEDLTLVLLSLLAIGAVDLLRPLTPFGSPGARYFFLHAFTNALISLACLPDMRRALLTPVEALVGPSLSPLPMALVASIHIYHALFFALRPDEIFHHVQFVVPLFVLSLVFKWDGGASQNFGAFFICGLPGGLNYAALVGVKEGWLSALSQKRFDAWINACLRAPGCIVYAALQWQVWLAGARPTKGWSQASIDFFTLLVTSLMVFNGVYYMEQAIGNYHQHRLREEVQARVSGEQYAAIFPAAAKGRSAAAAGAPEAGAAAAGAGAGAGAAPVERAGKKRA